MANTGLLDGATFDRLADAVVALNPQPRERRWVGLSLCVVDAVWSIGANYDKVVVPLVRNLATKLGIEPPTVPRRTDRRRPPAGTRLAELSLDVLTGLTNRQRTSTRHGYSKPMRCCATRTCSSNMTPPTGRGDRPVRRRRPVCGRRHGASLDPG